ncbi:MAG TPA: DUF1801 domain-containing protein, partial [Terriglobales bacterium]|nr:DUF1801 domain-containing protein [Terriglobales bacterium]
GYWRGRVKLSNFAGLTKDEGSMAEQKMKPTAQSVDAFLDNVEDEARRADCVALTQLLKRVTKKEPQIWGGGLVGFGNYHYKYASGHEGDCFVAGFAPRKSALTLYVTAGVERFPKLLAKLGKHKAGKGCLYIKKLGDVDLSVLEDLLSQSVQWTTKTYKA